MNREQEPTLPDFKELSDRVIAPPPDSPIIRIRTNLDEQQVEEQEKKHSSQRGGTNLIYPLNVIKRCMMKTIHFL